MIGSLNSKIIWCFLRAKLECSVVRDPESKFKTLRGAY
jgi:hypothetical protein